jgi:hypothetical protein
MKKIFTILGLVSAVAFMNAQTVLLNETFSAYSTGGNATGTGSTGPDVTDVYTNATNVATFPVGTKVYQAGGMAKLGTGSLIGSMTTSPLNLSTDGGKFTVSFDVKGWTTVEGSITVIVTNLTSQTVTYSAVMSASPETKTVTFTGGMANSTITIATTAKRAYIDNVKVTTVIDVLNVSDINNTIKHNFVKNTFVKSDEITFGADVKDVKVYNMFGQIVKSASVKQNETVNVSELTKGNYIVTGTVNNEPVSQKILKD